MDSVLRAVAIYAILLVLFRLAGKRSLAQITTFDFVLLLVIGESTQQALIGNNFSITTAAVLISTLLGIDILMSFVKQRSTVVDKWLDDIPLIVVANGKPIPHHMAKARVDTADVMTAARELQGLERLEQVKYAVLERSGGISIIPQQAE